MTDVPHAEATAFFDDFVAAFAHFDGPLIARRYHVPYLAMHAAGRHDLLTSAEAVGAYFQRIVDQYRGDGCTACRHRGLQVVTMGGEALLATVSWDLLDASGGVLSTWRESYNLLRTPQGLRIFASTDH